MIGRARLVSASPFRASIKLDHNQSPQRRLNNDSDEDNDDEFQRDEMLPELNKLHESPIKDDSSLLRHQKTDFLTNFSIANNQAAGMRDSDNANSERTPKLESGDLKGIMIRENTRTSFEKRNSAQIMQNN